MENGFDGLSDSFWLRIVAFGIYASASLSTIVVKVINVTLSWFVFHLNRRWSLPFIDTACIGRTDGTA